MSPKRSTPTSMALAFAACVHTSPLAAQGLDHYAIEGARIVTVSGRVID